MLRSIIFYFVFFLIYIAPSISFAQDEEKIYGKDAFTSLQKNLNINLSFQEDFAKEFTEKMVCEKKYWRAKVLNMNVYCSSFTDKAYFGVLSIGEEITNTFVPTKEFAAYSVFKVTGLGVYFNYKCSYSKIYPGKMLDCTTRLFSPDIVFGKSSVFNIKSEDKSKIRIIIGTYGADTDLLIKESDNLFKYLGN